MAWSHDTFNGRPADLFTPTTEPVGVILYLHGYSEETLRSSDAFTSALERHRMAVVCPFGGKNWWLARGCPRFDETQTSHEYLLSLLPLLFEKFPTAWRRPALFGIGMGGQGALNLAFRNARTFPVVAALSPAIDFHNIYRQGTVLDELFETSEAARQHTATLHLQSLNWPEHMFLASDPHDPLWFDGAERLMEKLVSAGIQCDTDFATTSSTPNWAYWNQLADRTIHFLSHRIFQVPLPVVKPGE